MTTVTHQNCLVSKYEIACDEEVNQNLSSLKSNFLDFLQSKYINAKEQNEWETIYDELISNFLKYSARNSKDNLKVAWWQEGNQVCFLLEQSCKDDPSELAKKVQLPQDNLAKGGRGMYLVKKLSDNFEHWHWGKFYKQIVSKKHEFIKQDADVLNEQETVLRELEITYESLAAFRDIGNELIKHQNITDFFQAGITHLKRMMGSEPECVLICLSDKNLDVILEELTLMPNFFAPTNPEAEKIIALNKNHKAFFWEKNSDVADKDLLKNYTVGCSFPIITLDKFYGSLIVTYSNKSSTLTESEESCINTVADLFGIALAQFNIKVKRSREQKAIHELEIASEIQKNLIPISAPPKVPGHNLLIRHESVHVVGGDYLNATIDKSGNIIMTIADVMGKGITAAMVAAIFRTVYKQNINHFDNLLDLVNHINKYLSTQLTNLAHFVTCAMVKIDLQKNMLHVVNAGHPEVLRFKKGKYAEQIKSSGPPLGLFIDNKTYSEESFNIEKGDAILSVTDGLFEWTVDGNWWGWQNFTNYAKKNICTNPERFWDNLTSKIKNEADKDNAPDDRAMLFWQKI